MAENFTGMASGAFTEAFGFYECRNCHERFALKSTRDTHEEKCSENNN